MYCKALLFLASLAAPALAVSAANATYDYVIVGGGTAGLAIAARLAEDSSVSVAIVEAGGYYEVDGGPQNIIPGFVGAANVGTDPSDVSPIDWNFVMQPLTAANNRRLKYARGKTLGGSSARHFLVYQRGTKGVYERWAEQTGDDSWTWDNVLPFFQKSAHLTPANMSLRAPNTSVSYNPAAFSETGGPLHVSWPNYGSPFSTFVERGLEYIGVHAHTDFNSGSLNGSSWASITTQPQQKRDSSQTSFLNSAISTLTVYEHTMALRLEFHGKRAVGVRVSGAGLEHTIRARKEIILSAGAFQSPQLLMVSGIGPRETLQSHGITVVKDLPGVGQNLWDHPMFGVVHPVGCTTSSELLFNTAAAASAAAQYSAGQGPLTSPGFGVLGWQKIPRDQISKEAADALDAFPADWPDLEYLSVDGVLDGWHSAADQVVGDGRNYGSMAAALVAPLSRGNVTISSADANDAPVVDLAYLTHPVDRELAIKAVKLLRQAWIGADVANGAEYSPGVEVQTDEEILAFLRETVVPVYHAAGTCAMGKRSDPNAVVDSNARVIGVSGLRVVDASIFPVLPPGHPQSSVYMVAEKIADDIKNGN
ncbi:hypothetical protein BJX99DRAFT_261519 [Aspergillus californicus]